MTMEKFDVSWFYGKNPQEKAFSDAKEQGNTFFVQMDVYFQDSDSQTKAYSSYKDVLSFWKATKDIPAEEKSFYEMIREDLPCKFYADLEWSLTWKSKEDVLSAFYKAVDIVNNTIDYNTDWDEVNITDASRPETNKGSLHIIHPEMYFSNLADQRRYWNAVEIEMKKNQELYFVETTNTNFIVKTFVDFAVYTKNRAFRLVYSSKMKKGELERPLMPSITVDAKNINDFCITSQRNIPKDFVNVSTLPADITIGKREMWKKELLQGIVESYNVTVGELRKGFVTLKNKTGKRVCPIGGETNSTDNAYLTLKDNCVLYHCFDSGCKGRHKVIFTRKDDDLLDEIPWEKYTKMINSNFTQGTDKKTEQKDSYYIARNDVLTDLNKYLCVITGASKPYFMIRHTNTDVLGNKFVYYTRQIKGSLIETFENQKVSIPKRLEKYPLIDMWIHWDKRRTYQKEIFANPDLETKENEFNTFANFSIKQELALERGNKDINGFLNFIRVAWCQGKEDLFNWVISWFAHLIQKPLVKMSSAIVLQGEEGVGKGMVIQKLFKIIGQHYSCQPSSADDIMGNFNSIIDRKAGLFIDEMVWGGDKQRSGVMKKLITEEHGTINEKGIPQRDFISTYNVIVSSNEAWIVPAGNNARRFMILKVVDTTLDKSEVYDCCPYSLAKYLYQYDISGWKHDKIIATDALRDQKEMSTCNVMKFWLQMVREEELEFGNDISKDNLYAHFKTYYPDKYTDVRLFFKKLRTVVDLVETRAGGRGNRMRMIRLPSLDLCKQSLNQHFKQDMFSE